MTRENQSLIENFYCQYCGVIKPLIARIEAQSERIPLPLFNEIRAFNDHIARCYFNNPSEQYISEQIEKASRHIARITLDCFKCLIVILYQQVELFEHQTRNVDLTVIDNGTFFPEYSRLKVEAASFVKSAKIKENFDFASSLEEYEKACAVYSDIVDKIENVSEKTKWARVRFTSRKIITVAAWVMSIVISAIISAIFSCEIISSLFSR